MKNFKVLMLSDISGYCPDYHVGDEAMAEVAIERLGKLVGKENLYMGCTRPENIYETYGIKSFPFYSTTNKQSKRLFFTRPWSYFGGVVRSIIMLLKTDIVFICGGGNLTSVWPHVLESRLRLIKLANLLNKKVYLVSQTIGPYSDEHRTMVDALLSKAKFIGVRDKTFSHTQVSSKVHFAVDDACFLEAKHSDETQAIQDDNSPYCCLSMRFFGKANDDNLFRLASAVSKIASSQELKTIFIPHHAPGGVKGDIKLAHQVSSAWKEKDSFILLDPIPMASPLKALTSNSQWVVTMRYHQLIFALSKGVPAIGVFVNEYTEAKLRGAFEQFNLEPRVISIDDVENNLSELIATVLNEKEKYQAHAKVTLAEGLNDSMLPYNQACNN